MNFGQILDKVDFFYPVQLHHWLRQLLQTFGNPLSVESVMKALQTVNAAPASKSLRQGLTLLGHL